MTTAGTGRIRDADEVSALREEVARLAAQLADALRVKAQLEDFVENATIGLHRVGPDGRIVWANQAELDLLGYTREEYVGRPITDFHVDPPVIDSILQRLRRREALHNVEARLRARDGSIRHVLISSSVLDEGQEEFVHTRCFTRDITERRKAEDALRHSVEQLRTITDALPAFVSFVGSDLRYRFVNATYRRLLGESEAIGKRVDEVLGEAAYSVVRPYAEQALEGVEGSFETELTYRTGVTRTVAGSYIPQRAEDGTVLGFVALVTDITEKKALERFRDRATARAERLLRVTGAVADAVSADEVYHALVVHAAEAVNADSAGLWVVDEDGRTARLVASRGYSQATQRALASAAIDGALRLPILDALASGVPLWLSSQAELLERYPHLAGRVTPGRRYRVACLPFISQGRVLGAVGYTFADEADADEPGFLLLVARYGAQAMERLRLLAAERRSRQVATAAASRLEVLGRASARFGETDLDLVARFRAVVEELGAALDSAVGVAVLEADGLLHAVATFHPDAAAGVELAALGKRAAMAPDDGFAAEVMRTGKAVVISSGDGGDLRATLPAGYQGFGATYPVYAVACVPLRNRSRVLGHVTAARVRAGQTYSAEDVTLLQELADRAAAAVENARLYHESVEARGRAEELYRFAQAVVAAGGVGEVFEAAFTAVDAALGVRRSAVLTVDGQGALRFHAWRGLSEGLRRQLEAAGPWAVASGGPPAPVVVSDLAVDPSTAPVAAALAEAGIAAVAVVPVVSGVRLLGRFVLFYERGRSPGPHDVDTARAIANHLGSVMTRFLAVARLEDTVRQNELFAAVLAHDLRNPLSAMMTAAQMLLLRREGEGTASDRETRPLGRIITSGQRMEAMIEQLLDFTRVRSGGGLSLQLAPTDLRDLVAQAVAELEMAHPQWRIQLEASGDNRGEWDADRLLQVVSNLVGNAGQHGAPGTDITVAVDGREQAVVRLAVHNHGSVPAALLPELFEPFRNTRHRRDQSRGLGLGLFIVREIARAHGGAVEVSSSELEGTTFRLWLPRTVPRRPRGSDDTTAPGAQA